MDVVESPRNFERIRTLQVTPSSPSVPAIPPSNESTVTITPSAQPQSTVPAVTPPSEATAPVSQGSFESRGSAIHVTSPSSQGVTTATWSSGSTLTGISETTIPGTPLSQGVTSTWGSGVTLTGSPSVSKGVTGTTWISGETLTGSSSVSQGVAGSTGSGATWSPSLSQGLTGNTWGSSERLTGSSLSQGATRTGASSSATVTGGRADETIELRFLFDNSSTDIVTKMPTTNIENLHQLAAAISETFQIPNETIYFFQRDLRVATEQEPLKRDISLDTLQRVSGMMVGGTECLHHYVYWTHLAEDAGNWTLKRARLHSILGLALSQLNSDLRATTFQLWETLKKLPLQTNPDPMIFDNHFISVMQRQVEAQETEKVSHMRSYFQYLATQNWEVNRGDIVSQLEREYKQHTENAYWETAEEILREQHKRLLQSMATLRATITALNGNTKFIDDQLRTHSFVAPIEARRLPAGGQTNLDVYSTFSDTPDRTEVITSTTKSIDFALISNMYDIQRQSFMFDSYKAEADLIWALVVQLTTRKKLWITRDQLRALIELIYMWNDTVEPERQSAIDWQGKQKFDTIEQLAGQGAAVSGVSNYKYNISFI